MVGTAVSPGSEPTISDVESEVVGTCANDLVNFGCTHPRGKGTVFPKVKLDVVLVIVWVTWVGNDEWVNVTAV